MIEKKENALIVFLKYPEENRVKTRLAASVGTSRACRLYSKIAKFVADSFSGSEKWETFFFYEPEERRKEVLEWIGVKEDFLFAQKGNSLGQKMAAAFRKCFSLDFTNVVIIGTDCVLMTEEDVETSFSLLSEKKFGAVLGPATDGGYYLLGLAEETDAVFRDVHWSTPRVFEETERQLRQNGIRYFLMRELSDIDEEKDIKMVEIEKRDRELARGLSGILYGEGEDKRT